MTRYTTFANVLLVLGLALLVLPTLVPTQQVLTHDSSQGVIENRTQLEQQGYEIVAYENLSERGQELYRQTLREGGVYSVPVGEGAPDFAYPTDGELGDMESFREQMALRSIVIERPENADLPPADEPVEAVEYRDERAEGRGPGSGLSDEAFRRQITRYDVVSTRTDHPPLTRPTSLLRLLSAAGGVIALGTGGYVRSKP